MQRLTRIQKPALLFLASILAFIFLAMTARNEAIAVVDPSNRHNVAVATNTEDGSSVFEPAFSVTSTGDDFVEHTNAAIASSNCNSCRTVAAAMQVVLVANPDPKSVTPSNLAVAVNERCTDCETLALAHQVVRPVQRPVAFSEDGNREIVDVQEDLQEFGKETEGRSPAETRERFSRLTAELDEAVDEELDTEDSSGKSPGNGERSDGNASERMEPATFGSAKAGRPASPLAATGPPAPASEPGAAQIQRAGGTP